MDTRAMRKWSLGKERLKNDNLGQSHSRLGELQGTKKPSLGGLNLVYFFPKARE